MQVLYLHRLCDFGILYNKVVVSLFEPHAGRVRTLKGRCKGTAILLRYARKRTRKCQTSTFCKFRKGVNLFWFSQGLVTEWTPATKVYPYSIPIVSV